MSDLAAWLASLNEEEHRAFEKQLGAVLQGILAEGTQPHHYPAIQSVHSDFDLSRLAEPAREKLNQQVMESGSLSS